MPSPNARPSHEVIRERAWAALWAILLREPPANPPPTEKAAGGEPAARGER